MSNNIVEYMCLQNKSKLNIEKPWCRAIVQDESCGVTKVFCESKIHIIVQTIQYDSHFDVNLYSDDLKLVDKSTAFKGGTSGSKLVVNSQTGICTFDLQLNTTSQNQECIAFYIVVSYVKQMGGTTFITSPPFASYSKYNITSGQSNNDVNMFLSSHHKFESGVSVTESTIGSTNTDAFVKSFSKHEMDHFYILKCPHTLSKSVLQSKIIIDEAIAYVGARCANLPQVPTSFNTHPAHCFLTSLYELHFFFVRSSLHEVLITTSVLHELLVADSSASSNILPPVVDLSQTTVSRRFFVYSKGFKRIKGQQKIETNCCSSSSDNSSFDELCASEAALCADDLIDLEQIMFGEDNAENTGENKKQKTM